MKKTIPFVLLLIIFSNFLNAQTNPQGELTNISFQKSDKQAICLIECSKPITYETFSLLNPNRLVLDLTKIGSISAPLLLEINDMGILKMTLSVHSAETVRILVYFMNDIPKYKIEENEKGINLVFITEGPQEILSTIKETPAEEKKEPQPKAEKQEPVKPVMFPAEDPSRIKNMSVGFDFSYFFFQDSFFQETYDKKAESFRGEFSFTLPIPVNNIDIWTAVSHFSKEGKTSLYGETLNFNSTTFSAALRYLRKIGIFTPFIGAGIDYISYKETFPEAWPVSSVGGSDIGYHFQGGVYIHIIPSISGKIQIRYLTSSTIEDNITVNLGGVEYAFGLNFHFDF